MATYYDRYEFFREDGKVKIVPNIKIETVNTDLSVVYDRNKMRFDNLSYKYYGDSNYGWLILLANTQYGSLEFNIPDGVTLNIPYPLSSALNRYETQVKDYLGI